MKRFVLSNGLVIPAALAVLSHTRLGVPSEYAIKLVQNEIKKHVTATHNDDTVPVYEAIEAAHKRYDSFVQDLSSMDFVTICISGFGDDGWNIACGQLNDAAISEFYDNDNVSSANVATLQDWLNTHRTQQLIDGTSGLYKDYHQYISDIDRWKNKRIY